MLCAKILVDFIRDKLNYTQKLMCTPITVVLSNVHSNVRSNVRSNKLVYLAQEDCHTNHPH